MRRIFSTFPGGGPGLGLLVLRAAIGFTLVSQGIHCLSDSHTPSLAMWAVALAMVASGTFGPDRVYDVCCHCWGPPHRSHLDAVVSCAHSKSVPHKAGNFLGRRDRNRHRLPRPRSVFT